jgi:hypothetical protein
MMQQSSALRRLELILDEALNNGDRNQEFGLIAVLGLMKDNNNNEQTSYEY